MDGAWGKRRYSCYSFLTSALEGGEWSASRLGRPLPPGKEPPVPTVQEAGWAPEPVWTQRKWKLYPRKNKSRLHYGNVFCHSLQNLFSFCCCGYKCRLYCVHVRCYFVSVRNHVSHIMGKNIGWGCVTSVVGVYQLVLCFKLYQLICRYCSFHPQGENLAETKGQELT
jgi:hypothetical protein